MVMSRKILMVFGIVFLIMPGLSAQNLRSMSFNGATGLFMVPTGNIGWERSAGLEFGYHGILNRNSNHLFNLGASFFRFAELSFAFDLQDNNYYDAQNNDLIIGTKIRIPSFNRDTSIGIGGNLQLLNIGEDRYTNRRFNRAVGGYYVAGQIYGAVTYRSTFFGSRAETSVAVGKTFYRGMDSSIDFGMGFDLLLLPQYLDRFVHVIIDFANFSYSDSPNPRISTNRGILNTGLRIDLSAIPPLNKFKFTIDALLTDGFDEGRSFSVGAVFGVPL
ncbi:hypothetical protein LQZ21_06385 [Treponema sp. TIM-1]|uniref:hypothetical protein n=1 Tax=Treponema sp. TIM-1 TaxID=2898417 RepID=UPI00397FA975